MWPAAVLVRLPLMIGGRRIRADLTSLFRVAARDSDLARQRREGYQPKGNALGFERIIHLLSLVFRHRIANNSERARVKRSEAPRIGGKQVIEQHDLELPDEHVQLLSDADAIAAFFGRLGYNTNARTVQTPGNLGITSESTLRRIRRLELISDDEGFLQVYLFQLVSLTLADARALAAAFCNRAGNFLLVLTADFERLDFVLVEKYLPAEQPAGIAKPQVKARPRTLTVERRKPERLQLRVLGRFTWTEVDGFAQYEKLLAAYSLAYWSEEYFNNRALFSDYFLKERLTDTGDFPEWKEDPKPAYARMRQIYRAATGIITGTGKEPLRTELLEPIFDELGFEVERGEEPARPNNPITGFTSAIAKLTISHWRFVWPIHGADFSMAGTRHAIRRPRLTIRGSGSSVFLRRARRHGS